MANTKSAEKRVRQIGRRTARNKSIRTRVKNARKSALAAVASGDGSVIPQAISKLASVADRAARKGVLHRNTARRIKKRLNAALARAAAKTRA